jgi:serine phosphatase RsbU (regulator of sigma subunit)
MRSALVPDALPERPGLEIASCFLPANEDVGGDFFVVGARGDATVFVLGDVVGRGLDAAMRASYVRTVLTSITRFEQDPARILTLTNDALMGDREEGTDFITAVCLTYRPDTQDVTWALAGHPPPVLLDEGRELGQSGTPGPPLGVTQDFTVPSQATQLDPGSGILLYTDGIVEARTAGNEDFGLDRLGEFVGKALASRMPDAEVLRRLSHAVVDHHGGRLNDDATTVLLHWHPPR